GTQPDPFCTLGPFGLGQTRFVGEHLTSWGAIFHALDLKRGQTVLEYGPGTGQLLLILARTGVDAHGVDVDQSSLDLVTMQADAMSLKIHLERAVFGAGFEGQQFDAIVFYEAFHHALDFRTVIAACKRKL